MREGKFIAVNNFSAQEHASSKNWHNLNVTDMALLDITCLSKNGISSDNQWPK